MKKHASILDYVNPGLDLDVWGQDGKLLPEHAKTIMDIINREIKAEKLAGQEQWIEQVKIIGSLTTYQYTFDSDLDIHISTDLKKFMELNKPNLTPEEANEFLLDIHRRVRREAPLLPGTQHPMEIFFENELTELEGQPVTKSRTGVFDILTNEWLVPSVSIDKDFTIKEIKDYVLKIAEELASEFDKEFGKIKRDTRTIDELQYAISRWDG